MGAHAMLAVWWQLSVGAWHAACPAAEHCPSPGEGLLVGEQEFTPIPDSKGSPKCDGGWVGGRHLGV